MVYVYKLLTTGSMDEDNYRRRCSNIGHKYIKDLVNECIVITIFVAFNDIVIVLMSYTTALYSYNNFSFIP